MVDLYIEKKPAVLSAITSIYQNVGSSLELQELYKLLIEELIAITGCDACAILDIKDKQISHRAEKGFVKVMGSQPLTVNMPTFNQIITSKKGIYKNSLICCPIIMDNQVIGFVLLTAKEKNTFDSNHFDCVNQLANEISVILQRRLDLIIVKLKAFL